MSSKINDRNLEKLEYFHIGLRHMLRHMRTWTGKCETSQETVCVAFLLFFNGVSIFSGHTCFIVKTNRRMEEFVWTNGGSEEWQVGVLEIINLVGCQNKFSPQNETLGFQESRQNVRRVHVPRSSITLFQSHNMYTGR